MRHRRYALTDDESDSAASYAAYSSHSHQAGDQWVATEHQGERATGRVVSIRRNSDGDMLYEVELPLMSSHHGMTRVLRKACQILPIGGDWNEPRLALRTYAD